MEAPIYCPLPPEPGVFHNKWSGWADLNRRPPRPKRGALPTALHPGRPEYNLNNGETSSQIRWALDAGGVRQFFTVKCSGL